MGSGRGCTMLLPFEAAAPAGSCTHIPTQDAAQHKLGIRAEPGLLQGPGAKHQPLSLMGITGAPRRGGTFPVSQAISTWLGAAPQAWQQHTGTPPSSACPAPSQTSAPAALQTGTCQPLQHPTAPQAQGSSTFTHSIAWSRDGVTTSAPHPHPMNPSSKQHMWGAWRCHWVAAEPGVVALLQASSPLHK